MTEFGTLAEVEVGDKTYGFYTYTTGKGKTGVYSGQVNGNGRAFKSAVPKEAFDLLVAKVSGSEGNDKASFDEQAADAWFDKE